MFSLHRVYVFSPLSSVAQTIRWLRAHFSYFSTSGSKYEFYLFISELHFSFQVFFFLLFVSFSVVCLISLSQHATLFRDDCQTRENNKHDELLERIHQLESKEAIILKESHELREQNELLEFRIIELEEGADKVSAKKSTFCTILKEICVFFCFRSQFELLC